MKPELEKTLFDTFPTEWFNMDMQSSCMCWGFSVGDGWCQILFDLFSEIQEISPPGYEIQQVKEKFGGLRVYDFKGNSEIDSLIKDAEKKASVTCDECGQPGEMTGSSWIAVRCEKHARI